MENITPAFNPCLKAMKNAAPIDVAPNSKATDVRNARGPWGNGCVCDAFPTCPSHNAELGLSTPLLLPIGGKLSSYDF